jgi:uncharacterized phage-associated protein
VKNAQRAILSLLTKSSLRQGRLSHTFLVKLLFLAAKEIPLRDRGPFYDFVPYKYGPFSFTLYRDLSELARNGWLVEGELLQIPGPQETAARDQARKMPAALRTGLAEVWDKYGGLSDRELITAVYDRYPDFTYLSELVPKPPPPPRAPIGIYTIGYEGASLDGFLNACIQNGIGQLLDVRNNPWSRKWGFSKSILSSHCLKMGLNYLHLPELGVPRENRKNLTTRESYLDLLDHYEKLILPGKKAEMAQALEFIRRRATALVCMEADVTLCHRGRLAKELSRISGLPVRHLEAK